MEDAAPVDPNAVLGQLASSLGEADRKLSLLEDTIASLGQVRHDQNGEPALADQTWSDALEAARSLHDRLADSVRLMEAGAASLAAQPAATEDPSTRGSAAAIAGIANSQLVLSRLVDRFNSEARRLEGVSAEANQALSILQPDREE